MNTETFGELIQRLRAENKLTLSEVASALDISPSTLSEIENDTKIAPQQIIKPLSDFFQYDYRKLQVKYLSEKLFHELETADFSLEALAVAKKKLERKQRGIPLDLKRQHIVKKINAYFKNKPVDKAWLFGSLARGEYSRDSDLDILVRFIQPNQLDLFDYVGISQDLEDLTGRKVDLVQEGFVLPMAKKDIDEEKVLIYERKTG